MNKTLPARLSSCAGVLFLLIVAHVCKNVSFISHAYADSITLRADDWCPYNCDPASPQPGYIIEIANRVFGEAGHAVDYKIMPWKRTLKEVEDGTYIGAVGADAGDSPNLVYPRVPVGIADNGFLFKKGLNFTYTRPVSLDRYKIAAVLDVSFDEEIDAYLKANVGKGGRVQLNSGEDVGLANLKKLLLGRVDLVVDNPYVLMYTVHRLKAEDKVEMVRTGKLTEIHIGFSPKNPRSKEYAEIFSAGIERLRKTGELTSILSKYGVSDWVGGKAK